MRPTKNKKQNISQRAHKSPLKKGKDGKKRDRTAAAQDSRRDKDGGCHTTHRHAKKHLVLLGVGASPYTADSYCLAEALYGAPGKNRGAKIKKNHHIAFSFLAISITMRYSIIKG